jgi:membrane fusion protein, multidrug efflux system
VQAHSVLISPQVSGYISAVPVGDNQAVRAGQVLARIDVRDYLTALAAARANVPTARAAIDNLVQRIIQQRLAIVEAKAAVATDQAALTYSQEQSGRFSSLAHNGAASVQESQQWQTDQRENHAALARDSAAVGVAQQQVQVLGTQLAEAKGTLAHQQAVLHQAQLNVGYTTIVAPVDGTVGVRTVRVGQYVQEALS